MGENHGGMMEGYSDYGYIRTQFNPDEINLIYQFGMENKEKTCAELSVILPGIRHSGTRQLVNSTLNKLNALPEQKFNELLSTVKRHKIAERDRSIEERKAEAEKDSGRVKKSSRRNCGR